MEWVETTGKTVHDAKETALDALGVDTDDAEFEIINDARTGLFGRVKEEARVRARVRPTTPRAKDDRRRRRRGGKGRGGQGEAVSGRRMERTGVDRRPKTGESQGVRPEAPTPTRATTTRRTQTRESRRT